MDKEYPESEFYKDDQTRKWVRNIRKVVLNRQIFPVYTSMETMDKDVHDLTVSDMKSITFQVIPQFYWKYDWTYNQFMIHRVGKLNPTSDGIQMYDMLGNVWELVRDGWSDRVSQLDGKVNPIVDSGDDNKFVIKGGAFDHLIRNIISPSREPIGDKECRSMHGTQANVGFRPSMVFTVEDDGSAFAEGSPVDLFFLFDASASQNNQIHNMVEQA